LDKQATVSFINQALKGLSKNSYAELLRKCQEVKTEDVIAAIQKYFLPLFDPATSVAVVVATPSQVDHIEEGLTKAGFVVEKQAMKVDREGEEIDECGSSGSGSE
jgi:hypothetical protein